MYPKLFFERFWEGEQRNILFVCMPFHDAFDARFNDIILPAAKEAGFIDAVRVKEDIDGNVVIDKILDGIANSKMVLIDFTDDPKSACIHSRHVNGNVLYEAGIAHAMRESSSIVMIRDQDPCTADFDIRGLTINQSSKGILSKEWLLDLLRSSLANHNWAESKRVKIAAESMDEIGLTLMHDIGKRPEGWNHFSTNSLDALQKMSVLRLVDLGILWFHTGKPDAPREYAYHWTPFGYAVMKYLGITQWAIEEFKLQPGYQKAVAEQKEYEEYKKRLKMP